MADKHCCLFVDTMIFLHFPSLDQLKLHELLDVDQITVIVPLVIIQELEKHKDSHRNQGVKDRARQTLKTIRNAVDGTQVLGKNINLAFFNPDTYEPMRTLGLDPTSNDNRFVMAARVYSNKVSYDAQRVVILSQNTGVHLICRSQNLECKELDETLKLPEELSQAERELRDVKNELNRFKYAVPKLSMCFVQADPRKQHATFRVRNFVRRDEQKMEEELRSLYNQWPLMQHPNPAAEPVKADGTIVFVSDDEESHPISKEEYERYNKDVIQYLGRYARYLNALDDYDHQQHLSCCFQLQISNDGTAVADDVDILVLFPDGFELKQGKELLKRPKAPAKPTKPRTATDVIRDRIKGGMETALRSLSVPTMTTQHVLDLSPLTITRTNSFEVECTFPSIKHGVPVVLPQLHAVFSSYENAGSFNCSYELRPSNLPEAVTGTLHFIVEK